MLMSLPTLFAAARSVDPFEATREIQPPTISAPDATRADDRYVLSAGSSSTAYAALLKGNTPATLESCVDAFPAEYRAACVSQFDETKQVNIEQLASACTWVPHEDVVMSAHGPPPYIDLEHDYTVSYERCVQSTPTGEVWELARVGPWTTTGGIDWNSVLSSSYACDLHDSVGGGFDIPIEKQKLPGMANQMSTRCNVALRPPDLPFFEDQFAWTRGGTADGHLVVAISEYMLGAISPSGRLLGYPPIHAHHLHIEEGRPASDTGPSPPGSPPDWLASAYGALVAHGDEQVKTTASSFCMRWRCPCSYLPNHLPNLLACPLTRSLSFSIPRLPRSVSRGRTASVVSSRGRSLVTPQCCASRWPSPWTSRMCAPTAARPCDGIHSWRSRADHATAVARP